MKPAKETLGLVLGIVSVSIFWVPPIGLGLGIAGISVATSRLKQNRRFAKLAIAISALGILLFVGFWGAIWALSQ
jgi:hypothetical protein